MRSALMVFSVMLLMFAATAAFAQCCPTPAPVAIAPCTVQCPAPVQPACDACAKPVPTCDVCAQQFVAPVQTCCPSTIGAGPSVQCDTCHQRNLYQGNTFGY